MFSSLGSTYYRPSTSGANGQFADDAKKMADKLFKPKVDPEFEALLKSVQKNAQNTFHTAATEQIKSKAAQPLHTLHVLPQGTHQAAQSLTLPPVIIDPPLASIDKITQAAQALQNQNASSALPAAGMLAAKTLNPSGPFALVPLFFWLIVNSEEKHLHNYDVNIKATPTRKIFRFAIGNEQEERSLAVEIIAGKKIRFLHEEGEKSNDELRPLFASGNLLTRSSRGFGPLKWEALLWKRQTHLSFIKINIQDPFNPELINGPLYYTIPFSDNEIMQIKLEDPYALHSEAEDTGEQGNPLEFSSMNSMVVNIPETQFNSTEKCIQRIPLPHLEDQKNPYLEIEQECPL